MSFIFIYEMQFSPFAVQSSMIKMLVKIIEVNPEEIQLVAMCNSRFP